MKVDKSTQVTSAEIKARKVRKIIRHLKKQPNDEQAQASLQALGGTFSMILADEIIDAKNRRLERSRLKWEEHHARKFKAYKARVLKAKKSGPVTTRSKKPETFTFADLERLVS